MKNKSTINRCVTRVLSGEPESHLVQDKYRSDSAGKKSYTPFTQHQVRVGWTIFKSGILCLIFVLAGSRTYAQENQASQPPATHTLKGTITSSTDKAPLPGVNIYLKNTTTGTFTDEQGHFEFPVQVHSGDVVVFSFLGKEPIQYIVSDKAPSIIELNLPLDDTIMIGDAAVNGVYSPPSSSMHKLWQKMKAVF